MMSFAGTLQVLFGAVIVYAFYVAGLALDALRERGGREALRSLAGAGGAQLLGLCLAAVVLLPTFAHFPHTARALGMTQAFGSMGSVHPLQLLGFVVNDAAAQLGGGLAFDFDGASFYAGALTLPLAMHSTGLPIGIQLGGIGGIAPERKADLAQLAFKAMIGGAIASWMTASIAGVLI